MIHFRSLIGHVIGTGFLLAGAATLDACTDKFSGCAAARACKSAIGGDSSAGADDESNHGGEANAGSDTGGVGGEQGIGEIGFGGEMNNVGGNASHGEGQTDTTEDCDSSASPLELSCLLTSEYSVFVAPSGSDSNDGTKNNPVATIARGLAVAKETNRWHVVLCNATYKESVSVTRSTGPIAIHGGFACPSDVSAWSPISGRPKILAPVAKAAITFDGVNDGFVVENVDLQSSDARGRGTSSMAVVALNSRSIVIKDSSINAGKGADGADGDVSAYVFPSVDELRGNDPTGQTGAPEKVCQCPDGTTSTGGAGSNGSSKLPGQQGLPNYLGEGQGGVTGGCTDTRGGDGSNGHNGTNGVGASTLGKVDATGWHPSPGVDGLPGKPGQGGGGGAGGVRDGGGSGGCGGCGGSDGPAGGGGGASVAVLSIDSRIEFHNVELIAADAGRGGNGSMGQQGQQISGSGGTNADSCSRGGVGGLGGAGGAGGGGAGGVSVGILFNGVQPALDQVVITTGAAGIAGKGGVPGDNDGVVGVAVNLLNAG